MIHTPEHTQCKYISSKLFQLMRVRKPVGSVSMVTRKSISGAWPTSVCSCTGSAVASKKRRGTKKKKTLKKTVSHQLIGRF